MFPHFAQMNYYRVNFSQNSIAVTMQALLTYPAIGTTFNGLTFTFSPPFSTP